MIRLLRPHQWIKNGIIFMPLLFGGRLLEVEAVVSTLIAAISFCLISSSIYCLNDVVDYESDKTDPVKCHRPVASGKVSNSQAFWIGVVTGIAGFSLSFIFLPLSIIGVSGFYFLINLAYCLWLKHQMLIDVMVVAFGFVLRIIAGGLASDVELSQWIIIMTYLLALFLAIAKRRHELVMVERAEKAKVRKSVEGYSRSFLDVCLSLLGAVIILGYIIYTFQPHPFNSLLSDYLYVTALPVLYGILRYMRLTIVDNQSGSPTEVIYTDYGIGAAVGVWVISFICIIYL